MGMGFVVCSIVAVIFLAIGIGCRKSEEAVGFFTFVKPPVVEDVKRYNRAVSVLWIFAAGVLEVTAVPALFFEQNSPIFVLAAFAVVLLVVVMMIAYLKIEEKYKK